MNVSSIFTCLLLLLISILGNICCDNSQSCYLRDSSEYANKQNLLQRVSPLTGQQFQVKGKDSVKYFLSICGNITNKPWNVSVIQQTKDGSKTIGLRNETDIIGGDTWILLTYGGPNETNAGCINKTRILISCHSDVHKPELEFLEYNGNRKSEGCFYTFELKTSAVCLSKPEEGLSNGSVFCIIFLTAVGVYLVVGVFYRRLVKGAKGFEQIPHHEFWKKLGNLQADGCNLVCRREDRREESWRRLTNNFSDPQDDRDDALLRP